MQFQPGRLPSNARPLCDAPSITALAKRYGIPPKTLHSRVSCGESLDRITRPSEQRGKSVYWGSRTFVEWQDYLRSQGVHTTLSAIKSYYYYHIKRLGESKQQALTNFLQLHRVSCE